MGYTTEFDPKTMSRATGKELPISPKKSAEVCRALKGMHIEDAIAYLEKVMEKKQAVPFRRRNRYIGHKKGMGPAAYPVRPAFEIQRVLESAQSNAEATGLDPESLIIHTIAATKGQTDKYYRPRAQGRSTAWFHETTNVEIVLEVIEEE
ncbi:MAG: 50S ribosomal protein L22 [Thermoplasmata archaeon]|nr:50S ribosomal protein L22 [Thermoplasmata archaeon]